MALRSELWTTKTLCSWAALVGAGLYARHIAATQQWPASDGRGEAVIAVAHLIVPVALALIISVVRIILCRLSRIGEATAQRGRAPDGSFAT
jgi:hypothetical protein